MFELGAGVYYHYPSLIPSSASFSVFLPNIAEICILFSIAVKLSAESHTRLPPPYTSLCKHYFPDKCKSPGRYSSQTCSSACIGTIIARSCNCTDPIFLEGLPERDYEKVKLCTIGEDLKCAMARWGELDRGNVSEYVTEQCTPECNKTRYEVKSR